MLGYPKLHLYLPVCEMYPGSSVVAVLEPIVQNGTSKREVNPDVLYDTDEEEPLLKGKAPSIQ